MFASLSREELAELCAKMASALYASHEAALPAAIREVGIEGRDAREAVHTELMSLQPDLWRACR